MGVKGSLSERWLCGGRIACAGRIIHPIRFIPCHFCGQLYAQANTETGEIRDGAGTVTFCWEDIGCPSGTHTYDVTAIRLSFLAAPYWATGGSGPAGVVYPTDLVIAYEHTFTLTVP